MYQRSGHQRFGSVCVIAAVALGGCTTMERQIQSSGTMGSQDRDYITIAYELAQLDESAGKMAPSQAQDPRVVDVSSQLEQQAEALEPGLRSALRAEGVAPPDQPPPELAAELNQLRGLKGADFDRAYVAAELDLHKRALDVFKKEDATTQDGAMRTQVETELPAVQDDLAKLQSLTTIPSNTIG